MIIIRVSSTLQIELLLAAGLVYSFIVISRWHKLSKKYDTIAEDISKELKRDVGCIKSNNIFSPQNYLELITDECYIIHTSKPVLQQIEEILDDYGFPSVSYDLADVHTALSAGSPIVLVDCCDVDDDLHPVKSYRWFQVPADFCERN